MKGAIQLAREVVLYVRKRIVSGDAPMDKVKAEKEQAKEAKRVAKLKQQVSAMKVLKAENLKLKKDLSAKDRKVRKLEKDLEQANRNYAQLSRLQTTMRERLDKEIRMEKVRQKQLDQLRLKQ